MKPKAYKILQISIINDPKYFPRKKPDQLCVIVDTSKGEVYPVPVSIEHIDFAGMILGYTKEDIIKNPDIASKLVPSNLRLKNVYSNPEIYSIVTGQSGMEAGFGVKHSREQIDTAHELVFGFIMNGELVVKIEENRKRY